ncbi:MAG: S9 family peptidase, partial [Flavobacteriales bacterium]|nr:S9 family peptidase [Flavobacteriales bacterium]
DSGIVKLLDGKFIVRTNADTPNYKLVSIDPNNPAKENWKTLIPEKKSLLQGVSTGAGKLFAHYLENAQTKIYQSDIDKIELSEVELPGPGSASGFGGKIEDKTLFYSFSSFTYPGTTFEYNPETKKSELYFQPKLKFNPSDFESKQVWYKSKDGTKVSMFIVHKKGLKLDGNNPTYLYGYGGFNISLTPSFSTVNMVLLENGGVFAMTNLRGGGEYGEKWHEAGMLLKKQNVFDDFIAAGEYLISEKYTSKNKLAIAGGSNGGLLVGACLIQRPDLFKVAFPAVGVLDMLRYHKFTVGWGWVPEYGSSEQSKEMFEFLYGYSPIHNVKEGVEYPSTMITTADHDDRVVPAHSFKFAATLQEKGGGENPLLIRIEEKAGHGAGTPISKIIEQKADIWSFMLWEMGYKELKANK